MSLKALSTYKATLPSQTDGTDVTFYVTVTETDGNISESREYSYAVANGGGSQLEIPGFPLESIIAGLIIGLIALFYVKKKARTT
jgi:hypothetical protein